MRNGGGTLLGDAGYEQYQDYTRSPEQTVHFKEMLQDSNSTRITTKLIRDSRDVLSPLQVQALEDLRAVQQANSQKRNQPMQVLPNTPVLPAKPKQ